MSGIADGDSLSWLAATVILFIVFGLLKTGIVVSEMMEDENGKFEIVSRTESLHLLFDKSARFGVKYKRHQLDQKRYAAVLGGMSYIAATLAVLSLIGFAISVV